MQSLFDAATKQVGVEPITVEEPTIGDRWLGRRVGNYLIDRPLARGGMGSVYVARHPQLGREVAVKFLAQNIGTEPEIAARFLAEARVTASLNHPNIVEILDFGELDGQLYYAMELLRGKSLRAVMREHGKLTCAAIRPYVEQICWALEAAHRAGIVHRDLKPANVLVLDGEPVRLKLVDFGVAKLLSSGPTQTRAGQVLGTATHMAPEQALGDPSLVTHRSDLYSLGVIAYEMLTGAPVFHHESDVMLMVMHVRDAVRPIREHSPDVPDAVARLIERCLAKNPADRPESARALAEELARALNAPEPAAAPGVASPVASPAGPPKKPSAIADQPTRLASAPPPALPSPAPAAALDRTLAAATPPVAAAPPPVDRTLPAAKPPEVVGAPPARAASPAKPPERARALPTKAAGTTRVSPVVAPIAPSAEPTAEATISTLLARLQRKGDFPAFAKTIGEVSLKADANSAFSAGQLGDTILKDYALTAKLLRIVNATYARRFGGKIYSVQHAILILGFDRVRSLALSISLFKTQSGGPDAERISESAISALVSSELGRYLSQKARVSEDAATVCSMFKNLGRHLVLVYLPELYDRAQALAEAEGIEPALAVKRVLGISFEDLGTAVAKSWQLPQQVVAAMATSEPAGQLQRSEDRMNALAGFSNQLCDVITETTPDARERAVRDLCARYKGLVTLDQDALTALLQEVEASLHDRYSTLLGGALKSSRFLANAAAAAGLSALQLKDADDGAPKPPPLPLEERIRDVKERLARGEQPDAVLGVALRVVAEHLGAPNPLLLTAAADRKHLVVRFGLRDDLEGLKRELKLSLQPPPARPQPFASAYHSGKDLVIKDAFAKPSSDALPPAYFEILGSTALALYACLGKGVTPALLLVEAEAAESLPDPARVAELAELRPLIAQAAARR